MGDEPVVCARCGRSADAAPPTWSSSTGTDGLTRLCEVCSREHLRSIEARLDEQWWESPAG